MLRGQLASDHWYITFELAPVADGSSCEKIRYRYFGSHVPEQDLAKG